MTDSTFARSAEGIFKSALGAHQFVARVSGKPRSDDDYLEAGHSAPGVFYWVGSTACCAEAGDHRQRIALAAGDLIVFPRGGRHRLVPDCALGAGARPGGATLLRGEFAPGSGGNPMIQALPACFVVRAAGGSPHIQALARLLAAELDGPESGDQILLGKLADSMLLLAIRSYMGGHVEGPGLFAGMGDPRLAPVLAAVHDDPSRDWEVAQLARLANLSRTTFCARFSSVLGTTPMRYLTQWRMAEAVRLLGDPALSVARVSERLGYKTEAAFRRAFRRTHGYTPGAVRREIRKRV